MGVDIKDWIFFYSVSEPSLGSVSDCVSGSIDGSEMVSRGAIDINPSYAKAYNNRGMVWYERGNLDQALADYSKALEINANNANVYINIGLIWHDKGRNDLMCESFAKACSLGNCDKLRRVREDNLCLDFNPDIKNM